MDIFPRFNMPLAAFLSFSLITSPCSARAFVVIDDIDQKLQELGQKNKLNDLFSPIQRLNVASGKQAMIREAAAFLKKINGATGSKLTVNDAVGMMVNAASARGYHLNPNQVAALRNAILFEYNSCNVDGLIELAPPPHHVYDPVDMPDKAILGCVWVFCGALMCILPFPGAIAFGGSVIVGGLNQIIEGYADENKNNRRW